MTSFLLKFSVLLAEEFKICSACPSSNSSLKVQFFLPQYWLPQSFYSEVILSGCLCACMHMNMGIHTEVREQLLYLRLGLLIFTTMFTRLAAILLSLPSCHRNAGIVYECSTASIFYAGINLGIQIQTVRLARQAPESNSSP